jgi:small-conductance mechanosensitive channel
MGFPATASLAAVLAPPVALRRAVDRVEGWMDLGFKIGGAEVTIGSVLGAVLLFGLFLLGMALSKRLLRRFGERNRHVNQSTLYVVERTLHYLLLVVGVLWALGVAGIPMTQMGLFAGALGVGLGFGLQSIFNNFVCGLILLFDRSLKVGDFVDLASGVHGHVREIRMRATLVSTNDNIDILVPNSEFVNGRVVNWTLREVARRQRIPFRVAYGSDRDRVKQAALEAAAAVPYTVTLEGPRAPDVWLTDFGEFSLNFELVVWLNATATRRVGRVLAAYNWALHVALEKYGIVIPLPQREVHVTSWAADGEATSALVAGASGDPAPRDAAAAAGPNSAAQQNPNRQAPDAAR